MARYLLQFQWSSLFQSEAINKIKGGKMDMNELEQENLTGVNHEGNANRPLKVLTATSIIGDKVENLKGEEIGRIKDIMLDVREGKIEYVIIQFGGFLGFGEKLFAVPFSAMQVNENRRDFILDLDKEFMEKAPGFDKDHWPETNAHFSDVSEYWGSFMGPNYGSDV